MPYEKSLQKKTGMIVEFAPPYAGKLRGLGENQKILIETTYEAGGRYRITLLVVVCNVPAGFTSEIRFRFRLPVSIPGPWGETIVLAFPFSRQVKPRNRSGTKACKRGVPVRRPRTLRSVPDNDRTGSLVAHTSVIKTRHKSLGRPCVISRPR